MAGLFLWSLKCMFGSQTTSKFITKWMNKIFNTLSGIFIDENLVHDGIEMFGVIACALVLIMFFTEIVKRYQSSMLGFYQFCAMSIRMFVIFIVIGNLNPIMQAMFTVGNSIYDISRNSEFFESTSPKGKEITFNIGGWKWKEDELDNISMLTTVDDLSCDIEEDPCGLLTPTDETSEEYAAYEGHYNTGPIVEFDDMNQPITTVQSDTNEQTQETQLSEYEGVTAGNGYEHLKGVLRAHYGTASTLLGNNAIMVIILPGLILICLRIMCAFIATSNALKVLVKGILSPIAVAQCMEEGYRSNGIRYIRGFIADLAVMGIIVVVINAGTYLSGSLITNQILEDCNYVISCANIENIFTIQGAIMMILPDLAIFMGLMGATRISSLFMGE